jgi:TRAP-type C4-dicarboxylate transport system substrate-binding protein
MKAWITAAALVMVAAPSAAQQYTIKFATVAPDGSTWMKLLKEFDQAVQKESGGRVRFRTYPGGVQGKEQDVLRKIAIGQLHSGGFTGVGMGEVASAVRILDAPFLFRSRAEVDYILERFTPEFEQAFADGGYVLLGWAEVGFVHVFTNTEIKSPEDLRKLKLWTWEGDPLAQAAFRALNLSPIPLSLENVLSSLQTGLIDAFYTSPYAGLSLQWFTRAKYMVNVPLANAMGGVLLSKKYFDAMPADLQQIVLKNGRSYFRRLTELSRQDNDAAIKEFQKRGIKLLEARESDLKIYQDAGIRARRELAGKMYSEDLLKRIEAALAEFRKTAK